MRAATILIASVALCFGAAASEPPRTGVRSGDSGVDPAVPEVTLRVGDRAPGIDADAWINGAAVAKLESGKVYVVEFWATWCGPCVRNIPHLNELQKKYPAVTVIGVAASEPQPRYGLPDRREANVRKFIADKGEGMSYRNAYDSKQSVYTPWMTASGNSTIPKTFLVGTDGKIAWIGHPDDLEPELEKALARPAATARVGVQPSP